MTSAASGSQLRGLLLLGPAFVAAIAYVDPGNVAANISGGASYGYLLVWVLVLSNVLAGLLQFQSAKLGLVTGQSLPELLGDRLGKVARRAFWVQAEIIAAVTDLAEVIGGAIALYLLFGMPLLLGGVVIGAVSMLLLVAKDRLGQRVFEGIIVGLLAVIAVGTLFGLFVRPPDPGAVLGGLVPRLAGPQSLLLAASILGATVMPHAIYAHSAFARDRHGSTIRAIAGSPGISRLLRVTRWDVGVALTIAGIVNLGMLLLAAVNLPQSAGGDAIEQAFATIVRHLGTAVGVWFAIGLLASGLASTSVGSYAGAAIMSGLLKRRIPLLLRRLITLIPALVVLAIGVDPTLALVISQVVLSFGIPFALVPLISLSSNRVVMGEFANRRPMRFVLLAVVFIVVALNVALITIALA
jgi:manganese transport protein